MFEYQNYQPKQVVHDVFRAYDIRGVVGTQLDADAFYSIAQAISCRLHALNRRKIFLARDGRLTSETLARALAQGLLDSGIDVLDLGCVPTPVMYFATHVQPVDCGLMVTGSHNPADYNGIKMVLAGKTLVREDIELLYALNQSGQTQIGQGYYERFALNEQYVERILTDVKLKRRFKAVVDCGNGIAGPLAVEVLQKLGCDVIPLYCEVDGRFPNHHPDPTVEANLIDLKAAIVEHQAEIGLAFDGDGDRLGVVTNEGALIWPDRLMILYALDVLKRNPGATIVYDVKCSNHLAQAVEQAGGIATMCPTGHSIVKGVMKQEQAALAGEMSGHLFFKDRWYGFDDALYSAARLLEILSQSSQTVHAQFSVIPNSVNTPEIKIDVPESEKFTLVQRFSESAKFPNARMITLDGLRVEFSDGWGLIRASNTTPCLIARFEAENETSLIRIQALFKAQLLAIDPNLMVPF